MKGKRLGYTSKWFEYGLVDDVLLTAQLNLFQTNDDRNTEHYRYVAFTQWLKDKSSFSDIEISHVIELAKADDDVSFGGYMLKMLFFSTLLTDNQFESLAPVVINFGDWGKKLVTRERLKKRILNIDVTQKLFDDCLIYSEEFKDNILLLSIIEHTENPIFLKILTNDVYSKKVRNLAKQKLKNIKPDKFYKT